MIMTRSPRPPPPAGRSRPVWLPIAHAHGEVSPRPPTLPAHIRDSAPNTAGLRVRAPHILAGSRTSVREGQAGAVDWGHLQPASAPGGQAGEPTRKSIREQTDAFLPM
ncbi:hypothetical protein TREES_T100013940 [Tupaia chinensis]|uniref:Uncharacterized protein n=1 Tax=Tupaia chinensis TaxID=246437 RepID=L9KT56_TUPCH|nr:hypothetical protein TREES_T100013940 [Tupaia chinensis]